MLRLPVILGPHNSDNIMLGISFEDFKVCSNVLFHAQRISTLEQANTLAP